jgi:hypothetical protein
MAPEPTTWTVHLAARQPRKTAVALGVVLLALFGVWMLARGVWPGPGVVLIVGLAALLLLSSIAEFLLPQRYTLDADGAHLRAPGNARLLPWSQVRRVYLRRDGIKLSPLAAGGWAEAYRGVMLRSYDREALWTQVQAWLQAAGVSPEVIEER